MEEVAIKRNEAFAKMRGNLSKYAKTNDRRMVLRSMRNNKFLACLPLDPVQPDEASVHSLENELSHESIVLNGIAFHSNKDFLTVLHELCLKLCEMDGVAINPQFLYEQLVIRMARSTAAADSHFKLNAVMGSPDIIIMPVPMKRMPSCPIELNLFVHKGNVHAQVSTTNNCGLFRKADVKPLEPSKNRGRPWIALTTVVDERVNFSNSESVRHLRVKVPDLY